MYSFSKRQEIMMAAAVHVYNVMTYIHNILYYYRLLLFDSLPFENYRKASARCCVRLRVWQHGIQYF